MTEWVSILDFCQVSLAGLTDWLQKTAYDRLARQYLVISLTIAVTSDSGQLTVRRRIGNQHHHLGGILSPLQIRQRRC